MPDPRQTLLGDNQQTETGGNGQAPTEESRLKLHDGRELLDSQLETPEFDLPGVAAPGVITAIAGYIGAGKTPLILAAIAAMLRGDEFCGIQIPEPVPPDYKFTYLSQDSEHILKPLLHRMGLGPVLDSGRLQIAYLYESLAEGLTWLDVVREAHAATGSRGLLAVDTLPDWAAVKNEDDNAVMTEAFHPLVMAAGSGLSVVTPVFTWKSFDAKVEDDEVGPMHIRGAGAITAACAQIWTYKHPCPKVDDPNVRHMKLVRSKFTGEEEGFYVRLNPETGRINQHHVEVDVAKLYGKFQEDAKRVLTTVQDAEPAGLLHKDLAERTGIDYRNVGGVAKGLEEAGRLRSTGIPRSKKDPWTWHITPEGEAVLAAD